MTIAFIETILKLDVTRNSDLKFLGPMLALEELQNLIRFLLKYVEIGPAFSQCKFGLIKDTKEYGTTSVSMGQAVQHFSLGRENAHLVINAGTGGAKYGIYVKGPNGVHSIFDLKPRTQAASPNAIHMGGHYNHNGRTDEELIIEWEEEQKKLEIQLIEIAEWCESSGIRILSWDGIVTGPIRKHFENSSVMERSLMTAQLWKFFEIVKSVFPGIYGIPYFLSQEEEAKLENVACETMYKNLQSAKLVPENIEVLKNASCGIGQGSAQLLLGALVNLGMNRLERLAESKSYNGDELVLFFTDYLQTEKGRKFASDFNAQVDECVANGKIPVIPLKSGFLIAIEALLK